jgi:hypothetical protein
MTTVTSMATVFQVQFEARRRIGRRRRTAVVLWTPARLSGMRASVVVEAISLRPRS